MKKSDAIDDITDFINHYDGGNIQPYVTEKLVDFLVNELGMLPPDAMPSFLSIGERETKDATWAKTRWRWHE